ncbi:MAG: glycosyltransferase family 2 protein [Candidatus Scalinduaceae bacterium]
MPRVSVIIPAYNVERYIGETLDSVLVQTYSDFEVIVVDDGSNDRTAFIIKKYQKKNPEKVRLIQKENAGPARARNVGIKASTGEYIAFVDADDLWLPEKLEKQVSYFEKQPPQVGMVYTNAKKFDQQGIWTLPKRYRKKRVEGWIYKDLLRENMIPNQSVMVRKRCFEKVGLFEESLDIIEDHDMWLRVAMKYEIAFLNEVLSLYREHSQGRSKGVEKTMKRAIGVMDKHLKMALGNIELEDTIKRSFSQRLYEFGYFYLKEGRMLAARQMFDRSLAMSFCYKTHLAKIASFFPLRLLNLSNKLIKSIFKPPIIVKSKNI